MLIQRDKTIQTEQKEVSAELINLFNYFDSYRKQYDKQAVENYKLVVGYKEDEDGEDGRSNLHIPRTYQIVDTIRARIVMAFFNRRPYIEFVPMPSLANRMTLEEAEEKAKIASALLDEQLEKNNIVSKFYDYVTSFLIFPAGILGVGWRYEEDYIKRKVPVPEIIQTQFGFQYTGNYVYQWREGKEVVWDDNEIVNVDYFDFWPDPMGTDIDSCRGVFTREFVTLEELTHRLKFLSYLDEGIIYPVDLEELKDTTSLEQGRKERLSAIGISIDTFDIFSNSDDERFRKNTPFELLHYWEDKRHAIIINRRYVIYDGPSPYWRHGKKPFVVGVYDKLPNEFYGQSAVQIIHDLQHEENTIHNQRSDNVNMIINRMWKVRRGADIEESELISRPHGIVHVDDPEDVEEFAMRDVAASSFAQQNIVAQLMENALGTPPIIQGAESRGEQTATETMKQSTNAGMRFDVKINLYKSLNIKRLAYLMDLNNQQFIDSPRLVRVGPEEAIQWRLAEPGHLIGEYDYRPAGANTDPAVNKMVRREQLSQMMNFLIQAGIPFVNYYQLIKEWLESFDIENAQKFLLPKEVVQQQMMILQAANMAQMQNNQPTEAEQIANAMRGRSEGRRPQVERLTMERASGNVR